MRCGRPAWREWRGLANHGGLLSRGHGAWQLNGKVHGRDKAEAVSRRSCSGESLAPRNRTGAPENLLGGVVEPS